MQNLVNRHSVFFPAESISNITRSKGNQDGVQVLLTGPTGSLGAHILSQLLHCPSITKVHLTVRGATEHACHERVVRALSSRHLPIPEEFDSKVSIYSCKLSDPYLGLDGETYRNLAKGVNVILHLAWSVNFLLPVRSFANTHLAGLQYLIDFALSSPRAQPPRLVFCSSVASVSQHSDVSSISESITSDPGVAGPTGYAKSKWIAEQICHAAHQQTRLKGRIAVARVGQLSGATDTGIWSMSEAYPLILGSAKVTGTLPDLDDARRRQGNNQGEVLGWLPVNIAASAFVQYALSEPESAKNDEMPVYHVLNPSTRITWSNLLSTIQKHGSDTFNTISTAEWLEQLEVLQNDNEAEECKRNHPAMKLLGFWKDTYGPKSGSACTTKDTDNDGEVKGQEGPHHEMTRTVECMPVLTTAGHAMNEEYLLKLWVWIKQNI
jgi:thioester reductase-like protein